jgi:phage FluMu gp28-like protein
MSPAAPAVLLPYQQRWVADRSPVKLCEKSRRTGFSWATAAEGVLEAAARDGQDVWYVGYNKDMAQEFIRDSGDWAQQFGKAASAVEEILLEDGDDKKILTFRITFASGYRVSALSSRPSNLRGKQGYVILDEAAFHDDLEELLKAAIALLMWGGRVAVISTHDGVENAFNGLVQQVREKKKPYSLHRVTLDDAIAEGLYKRICLRLGVPWSTESEAKWRGDLIAFYGDAAEEELFCVPRASGGAYISHALVAARMTPAPVLRLAFKDDFVHQADDVRRAFVDSWCEEKLLPLLLELPRNDRHVFGEDFGRSGDLTVFAPMGIGADLVRRVPFLVELRNCPFRQQEQILFYIGDRLPRFSGGALDARGNGQSLSEFAAQRYGAARIAQVMLSDKWYLENLPPFRAAFEDALLLVPRDDDVAQDIRALRVVRGVPKLGDETRKGRDGGQRHGDSAIALALAYFASSIEASPIEFQSAGRREALTFSSRGRNPFGGY